MNGPIYEGKIPSMRPRVCNVVCVVNNANNILFVVVMHVMS